MLSNDDHAGTVTILLGVVVVVMAGVGMTVGVDKRIGYSGRESVIREDLEASRDKLDKLRRRLTLLSWDSADMNLDGDAGAYAKMKSEVADLKAKRSALLSTLREEKRLFEQLGNEYAAYRDRHRSRIRSAAIGEELGELKTRKGQEYSEVVIVRATDTGLEIRHKYGTARVLAADLDAGIQERFQWE